MILRRASDGIRSWLASAPPAIFSLYAVGASFTTYFCMYGYRKAFAAAKFSGVKLGEADLKVLLVVSQIAGYTLAKYLGIKVLAELRPERRAVAILACVGTAQAALLAYGSGLATLMLAAIFLNGLALGGVWGLVYGYLEGRRTSEILGAGLSCSFIVASGFAKNVGAFFLGRDVSEEWMPAVVGALYLPVFAVSVWLLDRIPAPSRDDEAERVERRPMDRWQRRSFLREHFFGLAFLLTAYVVITAYRDFRDNFMRELLEGVGWSAEERPLVLTLTELPIAVLVVAALGLLYLVKDNRRGFFGTHLVMLAGVVLIGASTLAYDFCELDGVAWITLVGLGLYLAYVPYGSVLFDRMVAAMGTAATAVFSIYVADALGYTGAIGVLLFKEFGPSEVPHLRFFRWFSYATAAVCAAGFAASWIYFARKRRRERPVDGVLLRGS